MLLLFIKLLSLLPFPFDLRTSRNFHGRTAITDSSRNIQGTFTDLRTYNNYGHFTEYSQNFHRLTDQRQLRTFHRIFMELLRTYGQTAITDFSWNFHGLMDERQLRTFHGIFTDLRMSRNCSRRIMVTGHKTLVIVHV